MHHGTNEQARIRMSRLRERRKTENESADRFQEARKTGRCYFFGEESPETNAKTNAAELQIHRELLRALGESNFKARQTYLHSINQDNCEMLELYDDVREGESLRDFAKRTFEAWLNYHRPNQPGHPNRTGLSYGPDCPVPGFNRPMQQLNREFGFVVPETLFDSWEAPEPETADAPIDVKTLPPLPFVQRNLEDEANKPKFGSTSLSNTIAFNKNTIPPANPDLPPAPKPELKPAPKPEPKSAQSPAQSATLRDAMKLRNEIGFVAWELLEGRKHD